MTTLRFTLTVRYIDLQKLKELLVRLFPNKNFAIDHEDDTFIISAPRKLTRNEIDAMRAARSGVNARSAVGVNLYSSLKICLIGLDLASNCLIPATMSTLLVQFRERIEGLRQRAANQRYYIDPKALESLRTYELVLDVVRGCGIPRHSQEECARTIMAIGFVTLSILVYIEQERLITKFLESDMFNKLDDRLPMNMDELDSIAPGQLKRFEEHQWQFKPVILERNTYKNIGDKFILPFKEDVRRSESDGSFGKIYSVTFEAAMQKLVPAPPPETSTTVKVIRKQLLFRGDEKSFNKEREVLKLLQQMKHPNIADLLCSYTYNEEHSLLFELEEMDLSEFLNLDHRFKDFESNTTFFTAFYGLASALETVHNCSLDDAEDFFTVIGYHHDIRPQNILVRANDFVLNDFGLAKMSEEENTSSGTPYKAGFGEYAAPECMDENFTHQRVGRAIDIWALGAMMVDIASFVEGGAEGKGESVRMRREEGPSPLKSNTRFHANGQLKKGVEEQIQSLERDAEDKTLRTFLKLSRNMLVSRDDRLDASTVRRNASYIAIKSLFRAALAGMVEFRRQLSVPMPDNNWLDLWKLSAWGEVINLNGAQLVTTRFADAIKDGQNSERKLQKTLLKLVKSLGTEPFHAGRNTRTGSDDMSSHRRSYGQRADEISKLVSELKRELPTSYQHDLDRRKLELIKQRDATEVPELADEALQSCPDPESTREPTGETPTTFRKSSSVIESGNLLERRVTSPDVGTKLTQKTPAPKATTFDVDSSAEIPASIFDSLNNRHSDITTPDLAEGGTSLEQARSDSRVSQPIHKPSLTLPEPSIQERPSDEAHGAILAGTGIVASLTFTQQNIRQTVRSEVHVRENPSGHKLIFCNDVDRNISFCHDLTQSASRYPHTDHPIGEGGSSHTVYFFGKQILEEQRPPISFSSTKTDAHQRQSLGGGGSESTQIVTQDIQYYFASATDCNLFRARVWGKMLLISTGVKRVQGSKTSPGSVKADAVSLSVWESSGHLSVVFWPGEKEGKRHVELELSRSNPVLWQQQRRQMEEESSLMLRLVDPPPSNKKSIIKPKKTELRIDFDGKEDCAKFRSAILQYGASRA